MAHSLQSMNSDSAHPTADLPAAYASRVVRSSAAPHGAPRSMAGRPARTAVLLITGVGLLAMADLGLLIAGVLPWSVPAAMIAVGLLVSASMAVGYDLARNSLPHASMDANLAGLAHDLRAPLSTTRTLLDLVESGSMGRLPRRAGDALGRASLAAERVETLLEQSLGQESERRADLGRALSHALDSLHARIVESGAVIERGTLPVVAADPADMERVLTNLLLNSITHARPGEAPHVRVDASREGAHWVVTVSDRGPGIPSSLGERAFEPGVRGRTRAQSPGFGLGLATVRRLVERHGGRAWIEAQTEHGTAVQLELRAA